MTEGWHLFRRVGLVKAERLAEPETWTTDSGALMKGQAGDWRVSDGDRTWTVGTAEFERSYERVNCGFRRRGTVMARKGRAGEVVSTLEGDVEVRPGDMIVRGEGGETWPVPPARFAAAYAECSADE
jgi:hypothetical protein